ncbi:MAG: ADP-ribosylglycohydrolase family protein [Gammaproteobacteria bacterium]
MEELRINHDAHSSETTNRFRGCLVGLAVGDAVGTTLEFRARGTFEDITDMEGGGPFELTAGEWTDDTSMALCLGASLLHCGGFDARDQMNRYCNWRNLGYMSSTGECFDIGMTVSEALDRYLSSGEPIAGSKDPNTAGNGCIMRLAPIPMFFFPDADDIAQHARLSSMTTHGAAECLDASTLLAEVLRRALAGYEKSALLTDLPNLNGSEKLAAVAAGGWLGKSRDDIRGSGYVVDALEAAFWCFESSDNYKDCILLSANLGDDADTTAAIAGQIAGAHYGFDAIPPSWRTKLVMRDEIVDMADRLRSHSKKPN